MSTNEIWQVEIEGQIYEADTETMKSWVQGGYVQPGDKVKRGNLAWTEARNIPMIRNLLGAGAGQATPAQVGGTAQSSGAMYQQPSYGGGSSGHSSSHHSTSTTGTSASYGTVGSGGATGSQAASYAAYSQPGTGGVATAVCHNHPQTAPDYICGGCGAVLCKGCVNSVASGAICTLCGQLCQKYAEVTKQMQRQAFQKSGFGMEDLIQSLTYPLKHFVMFAVAAVAITAFGFIHDGLANLMMVGYISIIIRRIADGRVDEAVLLDFEDMRGVGFLGISIWLIIFGPAVVIRTTGIDETIGMSLGAAPLFLWPFSFGLLGVLAILWAVFYYPMALLVAGFSQSFGAVLNPLVGLDTIKRMGGVYVKVWLMYFGIEVVFVILKVVGAIAGILNLPIIGYAAFKPLEFFFNTMIACVLGLSIFKCADRLGVHV